MSFLSQLSEEKQQD